MLQVYVEVYKELQKIKPATERIIKETQDIKILQKASEGNPAKKFFTPIRAGFLVSGLAAETEKVYTGLETSLIRLVKYVDGSIPDGADWHKRLLDIAGSESPGTRPPIISLPTMKLFDELRAFRHRIRHVYELEIDSKMVIEMAENVSKAYSLFLEDVTKFHKLLEPRLSAETLPPILTSLKINTGFGRSE